MMTEGPHPVFLPWPAEKVMLPSLAITSTPLIPPKSKNFCQAHARQRDWHMAKFDETTHRGGTEMQE
ncbi:hypothetical protein Pmani_033825 [Petrolisthes manimaculis]|uniref:Uncharacterized protein n=1 Tax=Petrolisthes manimaculis TaxID=1843537 RepID=A0AAE1TS83_9EUCA|nr:hypothetical protein Pmani_033825 [Petrolisthes manimaculis]